MVVSRRQFVAGGGAALACGQRAAAADGNAHAQAEAPRVGALFPISGPDALLGDEALRGVKLAVDEVNAGGGIAQKDVQLVTADAVGQTQAESVAKAMIAGSQVGLVLGTGVSSLAYPGSDAAELAQTPYVELTATADGITGRNFKFLLRSCLTTSMVAAVAIAGAQSRFPGRKIGLLFNTGASAGAIAAAALAQWQAQKISPLISIGYPEDAADLHDPVGRLKRAGAELVLHAGGVDDVLVFFQAMQDVGWKPAGVIGCGEGYGLRETGFALGSVFDGTYVSAAPYYPAGATQVAASYRAKFGMQPRSADSLTAYVGAKTVLQTLAGLNGDAGKLLDALRKTDIPAGVLANGWGVSFDKTGQNTRAFATLQQWQSSGLVSLA